MFIRLSHVRNTGSVIVEIDRDRQQRHADARVAARATGCHHAAGCIGPGARLGRAPRRGQDGGR